MLDKPLPKRKNKRRQKNWKNKIIAKIGVEAAYLLPKITLTSNRPTKNSIALAKHTANFHIPLKYVISSWKKKKIG